MPFKPIDFASIEPQGNPALRDFVQNLAKGYQAGQLPQKLERERQKEELANQMQTLLVQEQPQKFGEESQQRQLKNAFQSLLNKEQPGKFGSEQESRAMERALHQANINKLNTEASLPFGGNLPPGDVGQALYTNMIKSKYGENSPEYKDARASYEANLEKTKAQTERTGQLMGGASFRAMPAAEKTRAMAYASGMQYDPVEAGKLFAQGYTLQDLADKKGVKLEDVEPNYALPSPLITQQKNRNAFISEINNLEKNISVPMSKVSRKVAGYSPVQIWGTISGKMSADEQGQILAARALQPELAAIRNRAAGGAVGIQAIQKMQNAVLGQLNVVESTVSPEAYAAMSKYVDKWLNEAVGAYSNSLSKGSALGTAPKTNEPEAQQMIDGKPVVNINGEWHYK